MKTVVEKYIAEQGLIASGHRVLVAVSGGADSTVLAHVLKSLGYEIAVAHCNFQLRGDESDGDEAAVRELAQLLGVEFHVKAFDTKSQVESSGKSVQMVARELRYDWFEFLCEEFNYDRIAVAQHKDDQVETVLLNLVRGTGLRGLRGMLPLNGNVVRPLLCVTKSEVLEYANDNNLSYRNDSSNESDDYRRNFVRNNVLDLLQKMNPSVVDTISMEADYLRDAEKIVAKDVAKKFEEVSETVGAATRISIEKLKSLDAVSFYLFEFLHKYGFNSDVVKAIVKSLDGPSGKQFASPTHQVLKDRDHLILSRPYTNGDIVHQIDDLVREIEAPIHLTFEEIPADNFEIPTSKSVACFDSDSITYPLTLRRWKQGDFFYPLGMKGKKLLSDFFIDNKISRLEKENIWLLVSADEIVWVVGHRIDNRFRVLSDSQQVTRVELR